MGEPIVLRCPRCRRLGTYARSIDPRIPAAVAEIVIICPKCDDGDFHEERWLDGRGVEIAPSDAPSTTEADR